MCIYSIYGYGKGKTESAIGITVRAIANHHKVLFAQFLKDGKSSEVDFLKMFREVTFLSTGTTGIVLPKNKQDKDKEAVLDLYNKICRRITTCEYNLLVLDEILVALDMELISISLFKRLIEACRKNKVDVYMTGRIRNGIIRSYVQQLSDCATNAYCVKHMFDTYCKKCDNTYPYYFTYCPECGEELVVSKPCKKGRDF